MRPHPPHFRTQHALNKPLLNTHTHPHPHPHTHTGPRGTADHGHIPCTAAAAVAGGQRLLPTQYRGSGLAPPHHKSAGDCLASGDSDNETDEFTLDAAAAFHAAAPLLNKAPEFHLKPPAQRWRSAGAGDAATTKAGLGGRLAQATYMPLCVS
jgi:hypothetical protein